MAFVAQGFCDDFFEALRQRYETFHISGVSPFLTWINSELIFTSLQSCRDRVGIDGRNDEPWSRFALHPPRLKPDDVEANETAQAAYALVLNNRGSRSRQ